MNWTDAAVPNAAGMLRPPFAPVGDAFAENFRNALELGASFTAFQNGELIVDIRGGFVDRKKEHSWTDDTIACIYSSGKAVMSFLIARAVSDGLLAYDKPVAAFWPEFGDAGKAEITIAQMLSHQGGLAGFKDEMPPESWLDWVLITKKIAVMEPLWEPGSASGYHPQIVGYIAGELLRRVTGKTAGALIREITEPNDLSLYCGLSETEMARTSFMPKPPKAPDLGVMNEFKKYAFLKPWSAPARVSREGWMAAEIPASNMHSAARALAAIVHPFANDGVDTNGKPVLEQSAIDAALKERVCGDDLVLPFRLSWAAGMMRNINRHFGPNENAYGHAGFGGSCVVIDPENNLTVAYVMNKMSPHLVGDPRAVHLLDALYDCL
ncbi:serine hydrolase domain-containing protein [Hyphococcus lacteus]|uniref:Serine hydrolase domain-containing protein n=1 Tax=Hyphococcus lacteus TaxID=3143536 RepID=A0ABV3Z125_9PROT